MVTIPPTPALVLGRLRRDPHDQAAWADLCQTYGKVIHAWCVRRHLGHHEAEDVTQNVLLKLLGSLPTRYDPGQRFRVWLRTCTRNAVIDYLRGLRARPDAARVAELLEDQTDGNSLEAALETEWHRELFHLACQRVRARLREPLTWQAFRLTLAVELGGEGLSPAEAAQQLDADRQQVFDARRRVTEFIRQEVRRLDQEL